MSLNWTLASEEARNEKNWGRTESFIFATMAVGLGSLTAKNEREWRVRLAMRGMANPYETEKTTNGFTYLAMLPPAEFAMRYGLSTNVSNETRAAFRKRLAEGLEREAEWKVREAARVEATLERETRTAVPA